jgi:hypothetical protein
VVIGGLPIFLESPSGFLFHPVSQLSMLVSPALLVFAVTCAMTAFPAIFLIFVSVDLQARSPVYYIVAGSLLGALCISLLARSLVIWTMWVGPLFVVAGLAAGLAYWLVAGRRALCEHAA